MKGFFCELVNIICTLCRWMLVRFFMLPLEVYFKLVLGRSAYLGKVIFGHVAIGAIGAWLNGWAFLAGVPELAHNPHFACGGQAC